MNKEQFDKLIEDFNKNVDTSHQNIVLHSIFGVISAFHLPDFDNVSKQRLLDELTRVIEYSVNAIKNE